MYIIPNCECKCLNVWRWWWKCRKVISEEKISQHLKKSIKVLLELVRSRDFTDLKESIWCWWRCHAIGHFAGQLSWYDEHRQKSAQQGNPHSSLMSCCLPPASPIKERLKSKQQSLKVKALKIQWSQDCTDAKTNLPKDRYRTFSTVKSPQWASAGSQLPKDDLTLINNQPSFSKGCHLLFDKSRNDI